MKTFSFLFFALCLSLTGAISQTNTSPAFPAAWSGEWKGTLELFIPSGKVQELPMEVHILPVEGSANFTWTLIYGEDKEAGKRAYELQTLDAAKGKYLIDEKNSILIEAYLLGGKFFQCFEVQGNLLYTSAELVGEELIWEILSGSLDPVSITGGQILAGEEIPNVKAFPLKVMQRARLRKA
jgi:hypothetical protein